MTNFMVRLPEFQQSLPKLLLLVFLSGIFGHLAAQQQAPVLKVSWSADSVQVKRGTTFSNVLILQNPSAETVDVQEITPAAAYAGLLLMPKAPLALPPGTSLRLPLKMLANNEFLKQNKDRISFALRYASASGQHQATASFALQKEEFNDIALIPLQREIFADPAQPRTVISFIVENRGYTARSLDLILKTEPDGLPLNRPRQAVTLGPLEQKTVEVVVTAPRHLQRFPEYRISVTAQDPRTDQQAGYLEINYVLLTASRQLTPAFNSGVLENFAELTYAGYSGGYDMLNLRANKQLSLGGNWNARLNLNSDYYLTSSLYSVYDSWLETSRGRTSLRLGNVQGSDYDYSLTGRGLRAATGLGADAEIEALALENDYSLFGTYFSGGQTSRLAGAKFSYGRSRPSRGKLSYVYEDNLRLQTESHLTHWSGAVALPEGHQLQLSAGLSSEKGRIQRDQQYGAAASANYEGKAGAWTFSSLNTLATSGYAGLTRGSLMLNERLTRALSRGRTVSLSYEQNRVAPHYLSFQQQPPQASEPFAYPSYFYSTRAASLSYQFPWHAWSFLLAPRVENQRSENNNTVRELFAYRLQTSASAAFGTHSLNLNADYAVAKLVGPAGWFTSLSATASYRFRNLALTGTVQYNPMYVTELPADNTPLLDFTNYNLYASYFFRKTGNPFSANISAGFNYSQLYRNVNSTLNAQLEYKTKSNWAATALLNYGDFRTLNSAGYHGNNYQFRVGLKKYFNTATEQGNHKIALQVFEDRNSNGQLDDGEQPAAQQLVRLDKYIARTDAHGRVSFLNVPTGSYTLKITDANGAPQTEFVLEVTSNIRRKLGIIQKVRVTGRMEEIKQSYDTVETSAVGTNVYARDTAGTTYTTVVDQQDRFEFLLPPGTYEVYIQSDQYNYEESQQSVVVRTGTAHPELLFRYRKKDTEVKVRKF